MHSRAHDFPTFPNLCFLGKSGRSIVGKNLSHDPSSTDPSVDQRRTRGLNLTARDAYDGLENIQDIHHLFLRIKYSPGLHWMGKRRRGWFVNNRSLILPRSETCVTETLFSPISYKLLFYLLVFLFFSFLFLERERERERGNFIRYIVSIRGGRKRSSRKFASCFKSRICFTFSQRDSSGRRINRGNASSGHVTQTERRKFHVQCFFAILFLLVNRPGSRDKGLRYRDIQF